MNDENGQRLKKIFGEAISKPPDERAPFVDSACSGDPELRERLQELLAAHEAASGFLAEPYRGEGPGDAEKEAEMKGKLIGDFRILRWIGSGGMGTVYEAQQISLNRTVALKVLPPHLSFQDVSILKFRREAEAAGRQSHPGIVAVHAVGEQDGIHYIAQELVEEGATLNDRLDRIRREGLPSSGYFRDTALFVAAVADALEHAHQSGVIHRDIKPSNLLITRDGNPKVTDFGLAKVEDALALSRTGEFAGTPYYMSPEQVQSRPTGIDKRTDIYSLGVTLYEMLTLKLPFEGKTSHEVLKQISLVDPVDPHKANSLVPRDLSVICLKAMEKTRARRYQTMREFADDLGRFVNGDVILAKPAGLNTRLWKRAKRNPLLSTSFLVALLSIVCFVGYELVWSIPQLKHEKKIAQDERDRALAAENKAENQAKIIQENYDRIMRLSDVKILSNLIEEADRLWPAIPEQIARFEDWIRRAEDVLGRLDEHQGTLTSLQAKAPTFYDVDGEQIPNHWVFEDTEIQWWHDTLSDLVSGLVELADTESGLLKKINDRLTFAATIEEKSIDDHTKAWEAAIASIGNREECPHYGGLEIKRQLGFVPIGRDPRSGLWEFAHLQTGTLAARGDDRNLALTEEMGLVFVLIPGGSFDMGAVLPSVLKPLGSPNADPGSLIQESPIRTVFLKPFLLSKYEMTQGQWLRFTGENRSSYKPGWGELTLLHPVEQLSWSDCERVLFRLNLRLPTESEWEYAARAKTTSIWWTGNDRESLQGAANLADLYAKTHGGPPNWPYAEWLDDGHNVHAPIGTYRPNAFGLHEVHGNVWEWCRDKYGNYAAAPTDGSSSEFEIYKLRVLRGGSWDRDETSCRSALRREDVPDYRSSDRGVRPASSLRE